MEELEVVSPQKKVVAENETKKNQKKKSSTQTKTAPPKTNGWTWKNDGLEFSEFPATQLWDFFWEGWNGSLGNLPKSTLAVYKQKKLRRKKTSVFYTCL